MTLILILLILALLFGIGAVLEGILWLFLLAGLLVLGAVALGVAVLRG